MRLNGLGGGEGPAGAAAALVLNSRNDTLGAPVDVGGKLGQRFEIEVGLLLGLEFVMFCFGAAEEGILLGGSQMTHVVDILFPSCT